jgi:hypothetical protein
MSTTKTEKIEKLDVKIQQLLNEKKRLINHNKETERKARTKRLIERGAILESLIPNFEDLSNEQVKRFLEKTIKTEFAQRIFNELKAWKPVAPTSANQPTKSAETDTSSNENFTQIS